jgi:D-aminoacyl-tRNA deacylase
MAVRGCPLEPPRTDALYPGAALCPAVIGIVVSRADRASEHVGEHLLECREWTAAEDDDRPDEAGGGTVHRSGPFELRTFADLHLHLDGVADAFDHPDLVAFASRHSGETGPLLTAHFTGNFGPAEYGGADGSLSRAAPAALDAVVAAFEDHAPDRYDVGIEATHHGPSEVGVPSLFVELGSDEDEWADPAGARGVARAILALDERGAGTGGVEPGAGADAEEASAGTGGVEPGAGADAEEAAAGRTVIGFGGGHYAPRFERVLRETDWRVGHVAADWALEAMGDPAENRGVVRQAFEASDATRALLDGDHPDLEAVVAELGYDVVSETWLRETDGVPPSLVDRVEAELGSVDGGLRLGDPAVGYEGDVAVVDLPGDLLAEALGVDADATRTAVAATLVAYGTEEAGTRPQGRGAVRSADDLDALVDRLVDVLRVSYESVERRDDVVVAREAAFDPDLARDLGVSPGPAFGRLADGDPVEVDGETVHPADVTVERTSRFDL